MIKLGKVEILYTNTIEKQIPHLTVAGAASLPPDTAIGRSKLEQQVIKFYWQALNSAALAGYLLDELPLDDDSSSEKLSLEILQTGARKQMAACGPEAQAYLQWKLDCYTYAVARAKELSITDSAE